MAGGESAERVQGSGGILWASYADHPKNDALSKEFQSKVLHGDRRPSPSLVFNYRQMYANFHEKADDRFAPGSKIVLTVGEVKFSWPLSGRFDFLDGQAGIGRYRMTSAADGFRTQTGWIVEPVRFDLHVASRFSDGKRWYTRLLYSVSYTAGVALFPAGFPENAFNSNIPTPQISGGEAIFEQGIVINVGRWLR